MRANKFNITFHAQDFDASKHFYEQIIQLEYISGWDSETGRGAVFAMTDQSELEFFGPPTGEPQTEVTPDGMKLALLVDDVDAEYERLKGKVQLVDAIDNRPWGDRSFGFSDPNGIHIYIFERLEKS